jgi:hypothetical protein
MTFASVAADRNIMQSLLPFLDKFSFVEWTIRLIVEDLLITSTELKIAT